jgi:uncharacterized membrane protein
MTDRTLRTTVAGLAALGVGIAGYVTYTRYAGTGLACPLGGCETVQSSPHFQLLGVPVSVYGLVAYLGILASAFRPGGGAAAAGVSLSLAGATFCGYLLVAEVFLIHEYCAWCAASNGVMAALVGANLVRARRAAGGAGRVAAVPRAAAG